MDEYEAMHARHVRELERAAREQAAADSPRGMYDVVSDASIRLRNALKYREMPDDQRRHLLAALEGLELAESALYDALPPLIVKED